MEFSRASVFSGPMVRVPFLHILDFTAQRLSLQASRAPFANGSQ
jgi:hypothetical protein